MQVEVDSDKDFIGLTSVHISFGLDEIRATKISHSYSLITVTSPDEMVMASKEVFLQTSSITEKNFV